MSRELLEPILQGGIRNTNYFNGRLLTAEDLKADQAATRRRQELLGQAIGEGVVSGLEVSIFSDGTDGNLPVLSLTPGLAINGEGQTLALNATLQVKLGQSTLSLPPE